MWKRGHGLASGAPAYERAGNGDANCLTLPRHISTLPRWNGHRPPFGDEGLGNQWEALQNRRASVCQSEVAMQPLEERRARDECYDIWIGRCKACFSDVLGRRANR